MAGRGGNGSAGGSRAGQHWRDRVVVVTGASSGVGRAIARRLGQAGAKVGLVARGRAGLDAAAAEVTALGGQALVLPLDVADADAVEAAAERVLAHWGRIDVWVNNAMVSVFSPVAKMTAEEFRRVLDVNYLGTVNGTRAALARMRGRGVIVQVGSALAYRSIPLQSAYCASKAAIRAFTDSLRCELAHDRSAIRLTMVQLPAMNTPHFGVVRNRMGRHARPVPPVYAPDTMAAAVLYAAEKGQRELWVGARTLAAIVGQMVMPGLLDRQLGQYAWNTQTTEALPPTTADNLEAALPGDRGADGPFGGETRTLCLPLWLRMHRPLVTGGLVALVAGGLALRLWARAGR